MFIQSDKFKFIELETIEKNGKRYYVTEVGNLPSVTTFLSATKSEEFQKIIEDWKERVGEIEANKIVKKANVLGTEFHLIIEKFLKNEDLPKHDITTSWMFKNVKKYLSDNIDIVYAQEVPLYSKKLKLAGRADCIANWKGELTIIDFKTSSGERREDMIEDYFIQCCAYAIMFGELTGHYIKKFSIIMVDKKSYGVQIFEGNTKDYAGKLINRLEIFNRGR